jgi:hypothetical protein
LPQLIVPIGSPRAAWRTDQVAESKSIVLTGMVVHNGEGTGRDDKARATTQPRTIKQL